MNKKPVISSWSGGKDSCFALYKAMQQGYQAKYLLNFVSKGSKRGCFHGIEGKLMQLQAESIGIQLVQKEVSPDMKLYEKEFKEAVNELKKTGIKDMVFGDIYLLEHENWINRVCKDLGINPIEPLWNIPTKNILKEFIDLGFKSIIVSAKADLFDKNFVGRIIDNDLLHELEQRNICSCGENGEFHSFVFDGPLFKKKIKIQETEPVLKNGFWKHWFLDIRKYRLIDKR